jgi:hypothetical protein
LFADLSQAVRMDASFQAQQRKRELADWENEGGAGPKRAARRSATLALNDLVSWYGTMGDNQYFAALAESRR